MSDGTVEKRRPQPITRATGVYISASLIASLIGAGWVSGRKWQAAEARDAAMATEIEDIGDRQGKYIGQDGSLTEDIEALEDELAALKLWIQRQHPDAEVPR